MHPQQIHGYLLQFFKENECQILNDHDHYINVQLTIEMDKKIMNRPFYWKYLESTDGVPCPAQLTFITDKNKLVEDIKGEVVHIGSPRLSQLFQVTKELGSFVQMYERVVNKHESQTILTPWLGVNYKVSYYSDQTKEILYSLGINLMTGEQLNGFQESLSEVDLDRTMPENTFNLPYIIKPIRALERLDAVIENNIQQDDHTWAKEAKMRWEKDKEVLEHFYEGVENKPECYEMEKQAMEEQYETRIKIEIVNGGLFYLK
ncbi:YqhG family protein [Sporosarcina sp. FSL K6-1508]|uniref:YqhG family protein n=1 Tax=Sporosarcina sp. FSL K6-1508 TaxID=2921553 RepID=UPI0030F50B1C